MRLTGVHKPSGRLEVRLPDHPGELARLTSFVSHRDLNIHSILTYPAYISIRTVLRIGSIRTRLLAEDLRHAGFEVAVAAGEAVPSVIYAPACRTYSFRVTSIRSARSART